MTESGASQVRTRQNQLFRGNLDADELRAAAIFQRSGNPNRAEGSGGADFQNLFAPGGLQQYINQLRGGPFEVEEFLFSICLLRIVLLTFGFEFTQQLIEFRREPHFSPAPRICRATDSPALISFV